MLIWFNELTLACCFRCKCLSDTWVPEQVDDEPVPLSGNEVVEFLCRAGVVRFDEGLKDLLVLRRNNKLFERFVVPLDVEDIVDIECDWACMDVVSAS